MTSPPGASIILLGAAFVTFFDRALMPPVMTAIASDWAAGIEALGPALTGHVVAYGLVQIAWGALSSRIGQLRMLRVSLSLAALGSMASALAWDPTSLAVARTFTGGAFAATVPATLVYFADALPLAPRRAAMANVASSLALGMTIGTAAAATIGGLLSWRGAFAMAALLCTVTLVFVWRLRSAPVTRTPPTILRALHALLCDRWTLIVLGIAGLEGAVLVGAISFLPLALEHSGEPAPIAGLVTSVFGVSVIVSAQFVKRAMSRAPDWLSFAIGGGAAIVGYAAIGAHRSLLTIFFASIVLGFAWATAHTRLQTWMSVVVSAARPVGTALFGTALFAGGAVGAAAGMLFATSDAFSALFLAAGGLSAVFTAAAVTARLRYRRRDD